MKLIGERFCRGCGCTESRACPEGCEWVLLDVDLPTGICSACAWELNWEPVLMLTTGLETQPFRSVAT